MLRKRESAYFEMDGKEIVYIDFVTAWQMSVTTKEVCQRLDIKPTPRNCNRLASRASRLRRDKKSPLPLKRMKAPSTKSKITAADHRELMDIINSIKC